MLSRPCCAYNRSVAYQIYMRCILSRLFPHIYYVCSQLNLQMYILFHAFPSIMSIANLGLGSRILFHLFWVSFYLSKVWGWGFFLWKVSTPCWKVFCNLGKYDKRWYWQLDLYWHALLDIFTIVIYSSLIINLLCIIKTTNVLPLGHMWSYLILAILFRHVWFYCFQRFSIIWLSNLLTLSLPNEGYSKSDGRTQF